MEYLMTYGWAILIIAVVLGVLFQLGVFSGSALAPKAQPGSCQVQRLLGQVSLEGQCTGLLPQFVGSFNGLSAGILGPAITVNLNTGSGYTMCGWANLGALNSGGYGSVIVAVSYANTGLRVGDASAPVTGFMAGSGGGPYGTLASTYTTWNFYCIAYTSGSNSRGIYMNGTSLGTDTSGTNSIYSGLVEIGNLGYTCCSQTVNPYSLADVQLYNTSLSTGEIKALYLEGIGGAPIKIQNLVGWWPLNGNTNDYSGNNRNGNYIVGVAFNSSWSSAYTSP